MGLGCPANLGSWGLNDDATVQYMCSDDHQNDDDERGIQPIDCEGNERKPKQIEADVVVELGITNAERLAVSKHQPVLPLGHSRGGEQQTKHTGHANAYRTHPSTKNLVKPFDQWMGVGREFDRGEPIGDDQVEHRGNDEGDSEHCEHHQLATKNTPKNVATAQLVVPEIVDEEPGQESDREQ